MIIYIEKDALKSDLTFKILSKFKDAKIVEINNYKNIFDKKIPFPVEKCLILANAKGDLVSEVPENYSPAEKAFFFKNSLNCVFDCKYCYLKGAFKNNFQVIFVNYNEIKLAIISNIEFLRKAGYCGNIIFYASDYTDNLATEELTNFHSEFIPFFEQFEKVIMESRTKSSNIGSILNLPFIPKNTEFAFSLNPDSIIKEYEIGASFLEARILALNILLDKGYNVGLRFLPILPVPNYKDIYIEFLKFIKLSIDLKRVKTIQVGTLLYTIEDYNSILKKEPKADFLYRLVDKDALYVRASKEFRESIYAIFKEFLGEYNITLDNIGKTF